MLVAGLIVAGLAAALHVYIFVLESLVWTGERARATFRTGTREQAELTRFLAFNQGFYNLFLAIVTAAGIVVHLAGSATVARTLLLTGTGSMLAAALVLFAASPPHRQAAIRQGLLPLIAVALLVIAGPG